jgi:AraC-like DNA-binding protein
MQNKNDFCLWPNGTIPSYAPLWPLAIGDVECARPIQGGRHDYYCIHIVISGKLKLTIDNKTSIQVGEGDMFVIWPQNSYFYESVEAAPKPARILWMRIGGVLAEEYLHKLGFSEKRLFFKSPDPDKVKAIFNEFSRMAVKYDDTCEFNSISLLYELLIYRCGDSGVSLKQNARLSERVRHFMEQEVGRGFNIQQICSVFDISRFTLFNCFKNDMGISPEQYLQRIRINKAKSLLLTTDLPISRIALFSGYSNEQQMFRQFKKHVFMTPGDYRRVQ